MHSSTHVDLSAQLHTAVQGRGPVELPPLPDARLFVRAAYRAALEVSPGLGDLVHLDAQHLPAEGLDGLSAAAHQARGGWLLLTAGWRSVADRDGWLERFPRSRIFFAAGASCDDVPEGWAALCASEPHHLAATDPDLRSQRRQLRVLCQHGESVLLHGAPGSGRRALAGWAASALGQPGLFVVGHDLPGSLGGRWPLYPDVELLDAPQQQQLRRHLLQHRQVPEAPLPLAPRGTVLPAFAALAAGSPAMAHACAELSALVAHAENICLVGEIGVGKSYIAGLIHHASGRPGPLVRLQLTGTDPTMAWSALFGHKKGSFTGATSDHLGGFVQANQGTLFLDELSKLSAVHQPLLNTVLDPAARPGPGGAPARRPRFRRYLKPHGASAEVPSDVLVVLATNVGLDTMVARGFLRDLVSRLRPSVVRIPPLRERRAEILPLLRALRQHAAAEGDDEPAAVAALLAYRWPENVRELRGVAEQLDRRYPGQPLALAQLPPEIASAGRQQPLLMTSSGGLDSAQAGWSLGGGAPRLLATDAVVHIPPLAQRRGSLRRAILSQLGGHPIDADALEVLIERGQVEGLAWLRRYLGQVVLRPGPVTMARLDERLRLLPQRGHRLRAWWNPARDAGQPPRLVGMCRTFDFGHVLVGRAPDDNPIVRDPARAQALTGGAPLERLATPSFGRISRAHFLVARRDDRLEVEQIGRLAVSVFPIGAEGRAVYVEIVHHKQKLLELWFSLGDDGEADICEALAAQPSAAVSTVLSAIATSTAAAPPRRLTVPRRGPLPRQVWALSPRETTLLGRLIIDAGRSGASFTTFVRGVLQERVAASDPEWHWLGPHLLGEDDDRIAQRCARLLKYADNQALRELLCEAHARVPLKLPKRMAATIGAA